MDPLLSDLSSLCLSVSNRLSELPQSRPLTSHTVVASTKPATSNVQIAVAKAVSDAYQVKLRALTLSQAMVAPLGSNQLASIDQLVTSSALQSQQRQLNRSTLELQQELSRVQSQIQTLLLSKSADPVSSDVSVERSLSRADSILSSRFGATEFPKKTLVSCRPSLVQCTQTSSSHCNRITE